MLRGAQPVASMRNAGVKRAVRLRRRRGRNREQAFLIEGYRELSRAVEAGLPLESVYHCPAFYLGSNEPALLAGAAAACGARLIEAAPAVFAKLSYRDRPDGLLAVAPLPAWTLDRLPPPPADALYVVAAALEKPGNLGTLLRTADAVGAAGLICCDPVTDLFNPNVVRASVGTLFTVPAAQAPAAATRRWLAARGVRTVVTSPAAARCYTDHDLTGALAVVLGNEQCGLDAAWLRAAPAAVSIPLLGRADSINVAMAGAALLFEALRQRRRPPSAALQQQRKPHAAADAEGGDAAPRRAPPHLVEQGDRDAGAAGAQRMAHGQRPAVDVHP